LAGFAQRRLTATTKRLFASFLRWLVRRQRLLSALRRRGPVIRLGGVWLVTRHQEVCEVLERRAHFGVPYGPKVEALTGSFVLGIDEAGRHRRARSALDRADGRDGSERHRDGVERVGSQAEELATSLLDAADGGIDVVRGLTDPVVHASIEDYVGIGAPNAATLLRWCRAIGWDLLLNPEDDPRVVRAGKHAAEEMLGLVEDSIAKRRSEREADRQADVRDTLLDRLLVPDARGASPGGEEPLPTQDDETVRNNIVGLTVAWVVSVSRATAFSIDELLRRPELADARSAALAGDRDRVARHLFEALRFQPQAPILARVSRGAILSGDKRQRFIPADARVLLVASSALMDEQAVPCARRFRGDRDPRDYHLHFGHGMHSCWGEEIAVAQMTGIATALLRRDNLVRAAGRAGTLVREGPFPIRLNVAFAKGLR
jgi:cytochrome P450